MRSLTLLALSLLVACFVSSCCSFPDTTVCLKSSLSAIRQYADSFEGLSMSQARSRLAGGKLSEDDWGGRRMGGRELVATFPDYEVRVFFAKGKAMTTSVQVLSK